MAFYIRDNRQKNFQENVKKVNNLRNSAKKTAPTYAKAKTITAVLGFVIGGLLLFAAFRAGLHAPAEADAMGPGSMALVSAILTFAASFLLLAFLHNYYAYGCMIPALIYGLALAIPALTDTDLLTKGFSIPICGLILASGFTGKVLFEGLVRMGIRKPTNQPGSR